jgi:hypothetical protein
MSWPVAPLFPARGFSGRFNLLLNGFFLFFQAQLLSCVLVLGLVLPAIVLGHAIVFSHRRIKPPAPRRFLRFQVPASRPSTFAQAKRALSLIGPFQSRRSASAIGRRARRRIAADIASVFEIPVPFALRHLAVAKRSCGSQAATTPSCRGVRSTPGSCRGIR